MKYNKKHKLMKKYFKEEKIKIIYIILLKTMLKE